jgi:hypothetical protein
MMQQDTKEGAAAILPAEPVMLSATAETIKAHISYHLGKPAWVWEDPSPSSNEAVDVLVVAPTSRRKFWVLVTSGMSDRAMAVPKGSVDRRYAELVVCLPEAWGLVESEFDPQQFAGKNGATAKYWPVQWLRGVARYPHNLGSWIEPGTVIPNGTPPAPFSTETRHCGVLIAPSVLLPASFLCLQIDAGKVIHFYSLWPLLRDEMAKKGKHGGAGLLPTFAKAGVTDLVNLKRKSTTNFFGWF